MEYNNLTMTTASKKNICVLINSLGRGGAEKQSLLLAKALNPYHNTFLVTLDDEELPPERLEIIHEENINFLPLGGNLMQKIQQLSELLKREKIEVLFSYLPKDNLVAGIAGKMSKVPHIYGGVRNAWLAKHKLSMLKILQRTAMEGMISNSHSGKTNLAERGFNEESILVMPNGIDVPSSYLDRPVKDHVTIVTVARFVEQKDYEIAIQTIAKLKEQYGLEGKITYRIIGYGELEQDIRNWIEKYNCSDMVEIYIKPSNIPELYQSSDIYFCTSIFEGLSNTLMEAMCYTLPIVATDVGDNSYLVKDHENGFIVPIKAVDQMAEKLYQLILDQRKRVNMGVNSYKRISEEYSFEAFQRNYLNLLANLN